MSRRAHSYSSLQVLAQCERKYALSYIENLESDKPEKVIFLRGNAFHAMIAAHLMERGSQRGTLLNRPEKIKIFSGLELSIDWTDPANPKVMSPDHGPEEALSAYAILAHIRQWEQEQEGERREEIETTLGGPLTEILSDLWVRYLTKWAGSDLQQDPLLVEFAWEREAPNGIMLQGRVDAVLYDHEMCLTIVRDSKTHDSWPSEPDAVLDLMNSQLHLQAWGIAPALREAGDYTPNAVEFDRIRSKKPTNPKLTTKGILSKSVSDFDSYTYQKWCQSEEAKAAGYEFDPEVATKADENPDAWFRRSMKPLSMNALKAHVTAAMAQGERADYIDPRTAGIVPSNACAWCPFLALCRTEIIAGRPDPLIPQDFGLVKRKPRE